MIIILSPAKTLDLSSNIKIKSCSEPYFKKYTLELASKLKNLSIDEIAGIMNISHKLSELNYERYQNFTNSRKLPAILAFDGDVYKGLDKKNYNDSDFAYAQDHVIILSGLYGALKPLDLIAPYRLEMGTEFKNINFFINNLYEFWNEKIQNYLNDSDHEYIINLASNEYFKSINPTKINKKIINIIFKENKNNKLQIIGINSKKARGLMTNYAIKNKIKNILDLQNFDEENYKFSKNLSTKNDWIFTR